MNGIINFFKDLFFEEYEVTIWFKVKQNEFKRESTKKVFYFKTITKSTQTHFVGKTHAGEEIVIKTTEPFDYCIRKIH